MLHSNVPADERNPGLPAPKKAPRRISSGKARTRGNAVSADQLGPGPESSPPMPTPSGLTPEQPRARRSSVHYSARDGGTPPGAGGFLRPGGPEEEHSEVDTPTKKTKPRPRAGSSEPANPAGPSPLRQTASPGPDVAPDKEEKKIPQPALGPSRAFPAMQDRAARSASETAVTAAAAAAATNLSGFQLDGDIAKLIRNGPEKDAELEPGAIYCFRVRLRQSGGDSDVQLLKIGMAKDAKGRLKNIKANCKHLKIVEHPRAVPEIVPFCGFAEKLIHKELDNYQHRWTCVCNRQHREYFCVSEDVAVEVFERWRDFCKAKPWGRDGRIRRGWERRLETRARFDGPEEGELDHAAFARRWAAFAAPRWFERYSSDAINLLESGWPTRWKIAAMVELATIVYVAPWSLCVEFWVMVVVALFFFDEVRGEGMHMTADVARFLEGGMQSSLVLWATPSRDKGATRAAESPAPETPLARNSEAEADRDIWEESTAASDEASGDAADPMDVDDDAGYRESTADVYGADNDACLSASLGTVSLQDMTSCTQESPSLLAEKGSGGGGVEINVVDLGGIDSD